MKTILHAALNKSFALLLAFSGGSLAVQAQFTPITLTAASFNQDLVAESGSNPQTVTTAALDGGGNNIFYSVAFQAANSALLTSGGLPNNGTFTSGVNSWQMKSYNGNNALFFGPQSAVSSNSLVLSTPGQYSQISLLDAAGYGPTSVTITLNFSNGTFTNYGSFSVLDWFDQTPFVVESLGRINRNATVSDNNAPATDPRLYQTVITLNAADQEKTLSSITILDNSTNNQATAAFFAVSGIVTTPLALDQLSLRGQFQGSANTVLLNWDAASGPDGTLFEVQRSADATNFSTISTVSPDNAAGVSVYSYTDESIAKGRSYFYRVMQTSSVGASVYSNIIQLQTAATSFFTVSQNAGTLYVNNGQNELATGFEIYGLTGQLCLKGSAPAAGRFSVDTHALAHGIYVIRLSNARQAQSIEFLQ